MAFNESQIKIIAQMTFDGKTDADIQEVMGVGKNMLREIRDSAQFKALIDELEGNVVSEDLTPEQVLEKIKESVPSALTVMYEVMMDKRASAANRLKAAEWFLAREPSIQHLVKTPEQGGQMLQQIYVDKRASVALARLVGELSGESGKEDWESMLESSIEEMPPSTA